MRQFALWFAATLILLPPGHAVSQETPEDLKELRSSSMNCLAPCLDYALTFELEYDRTFTSGQESLVSDSFNPTIESAISIAPVDHVRLVGAFVFEPVLDETPGQNYAFDNLGAYVYELYSQFDFGRFSVQAGKIHIPFGEAWDVAPGLFTSDIPGNYELEERIGVNAAYHFDAFGMDSVVQASAFTTDRTALSGSVFTHRPRTRLADGGAGNAAGVSSFALMLDGCLGASALECYGNGSWGYQIAALYQRAGRSGVDEEGNRIEAFDERGFAVSINRSFPFREGTLTIFGETAYFHRFEGSDDDAFFITTSAELETGPVSCSLTYANQNSLDSRTIDQSIEIAAFYDLSDYLSFAEEEWSIGLGYALDRKEEEGTDTHLVGVTLEIDFSGSYP